MGVGTTRVGESGVGFMFFCAWMSVARLGADVSLDCWQMTRAMMHCYKKIITPQEVMFTIPGCMVHSIP